MAPFSSVRRRPRLYHWYSNRSTSSPPPKKNRKKCLCSRTSSSKAASLPSFDRTSNHPSIRSLILSQSELRIASPFCSCSSENATPRMGNKGSFCEQDAPSFLRYQRPTKRRPSPSWTDTHYETFYSLPPKCLSSSLNLEPLPPGRSVVPVPFDIGKVESAAAALHFPFARGLLPSPLGAKLTPVEEERQSISDRHRMAWRGTRRHATPSMLSLFRSLSATW